MPDIPTVNPSPKSRFMAYKPFVDAHRELIQRPELQRAIDYAMQEMMFQVSMTEADGNSAAARYYQFKGAHVFVDTLKKLAETVALPKRMPGEREISHEFK